MNDVVTGLFSVCATLGKAPIIRAQRGGAAEMAATELDRRLRDHVKARGGLFAADDVGGFGGGFGGGAARGRPLLCLFDRNFDLASALQHGWTYAPLVHDVLGMRVNRVDIAGGDSSAAAAATMTKKSYDLEDNDPFWVRNYASEFPKVAEEVEAELAKYKKAMDEINRGVASSGGADEGDALGDQTRKLVSAVASLPELQERKKVIDKHTNIATRVARSDQSQRDRRVPRDRGRLALREVRQGGGDVAARGDGTGHPRG